MKDNTRPNRNLKVAFADNPLGPYSGISDTLTKKLTEGPTVLKTENEWLIYFDSYGDHTYGALRTKDFINFENITNEIDLPESHKHGTIFKVGINVLEGLMR